MSAPPILRTDPSAIPDKPSELTDEAWVQLAIDFAAMHRYIRVQYKKCEVKDAPSPPPPSQPAAPPAPPSP